jgi:DNA invertase Pin-like site-specific DNA recombinase
MIITNREKKDLAIELIKQGCPQSQIAKQAHLSFKTISEIRKKSKVTQDRITKKETTIICIISSLYVV